MTEWFEQWFGEEYHALYPHRDDEDAKHAVALIRAVVPWQRGDRLLDLACGPGRHAAEFEQLGARVVGFDLSHAMLRRARERTRGTVPLVRGDMRVLPFKANSFQVAVNLFTSFGYFLDDAEHRLVVGEVSSALAHGGHFVLDYLNAEQVRGALQLGAAPQRAGHEVRVTRRLGRDGRFVIKEIELRDEGRRFQERVRLYGTDELSAMLTAAGLRIVALFGDYDGSPPTPASPRVILVATRA